MKSTELTDKEHHTINNALSSIHTIISFLEKTISEKELIIRSYIGTKENILYLCHTKDIFGHVNYDYTHITQNDLETEYVDFFEYYKSIIGIDIFVINHREEVKETFYSELENAILSFKDFIKNHNFKSIKVKTKYYDIEEFNTYYIEL